VESRLAEIRGANGDVFGISADSPFSLAKWAEQEGYSFTLLSDFGKSVIKAYDVMIPEVRGIVGVPKRSAFLLDKQGKLVAQELVETPGTIPDLDGLINKLKSMA
jgi:glutaredoxin-dependent peroxiredoxin